VSILKSKWFLLYYHYGNVNSDDVKTVFSRFKLHKDMLILIDYAKNEVDYIFV
jgi:hypothetical protein